jgi:hypothetical protein
MPNIRERLLAEHQFVCLHCKKRLTPEDADKIVGASVYLHTECFDATDQVLKPGKPRLPMSIEEQKKIGEIKGARKPSRKEMKMLFAKFMAGELKVEGEDANESGKDDNADRGSV